MVWSGCNSPLLPPSARATVMALGPAPPRLPEAMLRAALEASARMAAPPGNPGGYFRGTSRFWMGAIAVSIGYFAWAVFLPSTIPYENLGQLGHFTKYLVDNHPKLLYNGFWLAWGIHIAEALYSIKLCKTKGITDSSVQRRWFIQTFLFGIASLSHLLAYKPPPKKQG